LKRKAKIKLDEIVEALKSFNFDEAYELYQKNHHYIEESEYNDLKSKYKTAQNLRVKKILNEIEQAMEDNDFSKANEIYQRYKTIVPESEYNKLNKRHKARVAQIKLGEIDQALKHNKFSEADELYQQHKNIVLETEYNKLKKRHMERIARIKLGEVEQTLKTYSFIKADKLYELNNAYITKERYLTLKKKYQKQQIEVDILSLLKERNYFNAEKIATKSPFISNKEYEALRLPYLKQDLKRIINLPITDEEAFETIEFIIKHESALINKLSLNKIKQFVADHINTFTFPFVLYQLIISDINDSLKDKKTPIDEDNILSVIVEYLNKSKSQNVDLMPLWNTFCSYPAILKRISLEKKDLLDKIEKTYPYEFIHILAPHYLPKEKIVLRFIKQGKIYRDKKLISLFKKLLKEHKYFNCEMFFSLRQRYLSR